MDPTLKELKNQLDEALGRFISSTNALYDLKPPLDRVSKTNVVSSSISDPTKDELINYREQYTECIYELASSIDQLYSILVIPVILNKSNYSVSQLISTSSTRVHEIVQHCHELLNEYYVNSSLVSIYFTNLFAIPTVTETTNWVSSVPIKANTVYSKTQENPSSSSNSSSNQTINVTSQLKPQSQQTSGIKTSFRNHLLLELLKLRILNNLFDSTKFPSYNKSIDKYQTKTIAHFPGIASFELFKSRPTTKRELHDESSSLWVKYAHILHNTNSSQSEQGSRKNNKNTNEVIKETMLLVEKPIMMYTQNDLEDAFRLVMYRWKMVDYNKDLALYVDLLMDRAAYLIIFNGTSEGLHASRYNVSGTHTTHSNRYLDSKQFYELISDGLCITNFDYAYRMELRFYALLFKLNRLFLKRSIIVKSPIPEKSAGSYEAIAQFFKKYAFNWSNSPMAELNKDVNRNRYMSLLIPPGDQEWLSYLFPLDSASTIDSIFKKLHKEVSETLINEACTQVSSIFLKNSVSVTKLRDELVLQSVETIFAFVGNNASKSLKPIINGNFSFKHRFVITEDIEDATMSNEYCFSKKPFMALLFSRYMVHKTYHTVLNNNSNDGGDTSEIIQKLKTILLSNTIPMPNNIKKRNVLFAYQEDPTIYHALSRMVILLASDFPDSKLTFHIWSCLLKEMNST